MKACIRTIKLKEKMCLTPWGYKKNGIRQEERGSGLLTTVFALDSCSWKLGLWTVLLNLFEIFLAYPLTFSFPVSGTSLWKSSFLTQIPLRKFLKALNGFKLIFLIHQFVSFLCSQKYYWMMHFLLLGRAKAFWSQLRLTRNVEFHFCLLRMCYFKMSWGLPWWRSG